MISSISSLERADSLAQQAYRAIRQSIQDGVIVHNGLYSESMLADSLEISRTPVREALIELAREGPVEVVPKRGFRLRVIGPKERREVFQLRGVLEAFIVKLLAKQATDEDIVRLREILHRQSSLLDNPKEFLAADEEFHLIMPLLAGLERTQQLMVSLRGALWLLGNTALAFHERAPHVVNEHIAVVDAIEAGAVDDAVAAIQSHLEATEKAVKMRDRQTSDSIPKGEI